MYFLDAHCQKQWASLGVKFWGKKKEKSGPEVEKLSSVKVLESVHYQKQWASPGVKFWGKKQEHKVSYRCSLPSPLQKRSKDYKGLHWCQNPAEDLFGLSAPHEPIFFEGLLPRKENKLIFLFPSFRKRTRPRPTRQKVLSPTLRTPSASNSLSVLNA